MKVVTHDDRQREVYAHWGTPAERFDVFEVHENPPSELVCEECGELSDVVVEFRDGVMLCAVCVCHAVERLKTWRVERGYS